MLYKNAIVPALLSLMFCVLSNDTNTKNINYVVSVRILLYFCLYLIDQLAPVAFEMFGQIID